MKKLLFALLALIVYVMTVRIRKENCINSCLINKNCFRQKDPDPCMESCQKKCKEQNSPILSPEEFCKLSCAVKRIVLVIKIL